MISEGSCDTQEILKIHVCIIEIHFLFIYIQIDNGSYKLYYYIITVLLYV